MGMGYAANYAYAIEVTPEIQEKLQLTQEDYDTYLNFENEDAIREKVSTALGIGPKTFDLYYHGDRERYDDLSDDTWYILFAEFVLFTKIKTRGYHNITNALGISPEIRQWISFG